MACRHATFGPDPTAARTRRRPRPTLKLAGVVLSVRLRTNDDLVDCIEVLRAVHRSDAYPMRWPRDPAGWITPSRVAAVWVAERAGGLIGDVCVVRDGTGATVSRLFVDPAARGMGCGAILLEATRSYAACEGLSLMLDVVDDGGPANWTAPDGRRPSVRVYTGPG